MELIADDILQKFDEYMDSVSIDELKEDFERINGIGTNGICVEEYLTSLGDNYFVV